MRSSKGMYGMQGFLCSKFVNTKKSMMSKSVCLNLPRRSHEPRKRYQWRNNLQPLRSIMANETITAMNAG